MVWSASTFLNFGDVSPHEFSLWLVASLGLILQDSFNVSPTFAQLLDPHILRSSLLYLEQMQEYVEAATVVEYSKTGCLLTLQQVNQSFSDMKDADNLPFKVSIPDYILGVSAEFLSPWSKRTTVGFWKCGEPTCEISCDSLYSEEYRTIVAICLNWKSCFVCVWLSVGRRLDWRTDATRSEWHCCRTAASCHFGLQHCSWYISRILFAPAPTGELTRFEAENGHHATESYQDWNWWVSCSTRTALS